jgi:predicted enzyme related to lactoylglutathione lyase
MSTVTGIDFVGLQVRDVAASAEFYEQVVGLTRSSEGPPHAAVFATSPIPFAVRAPEVDLDAVDRVGAGVALWFATDDIDKVHRRLVDHGTPIVVEPFDGPFGRTLAFSDPDGYVITVHDNT